MNIYNGWVFERNGVEWKVKGKQKIRKTYWVILECVKSCSGEGDQDAVLGDKRSMNHADIVSGIQTGTINFVRSEKP